MSFTISGDAMKAGRLDRRIRVQRKAATQNEFGEPVYTWSDYLTVWAQAKPISGAETFAASQFQAKADIQFLIRWSNASQTITTLDRVAFDGRTFDIVSVDEVGRREGLQILGYTVAENPVATD